MLSSDVGLTAVTIFEFFLHGSWDSTEASEMTWIDEICLLARLPPPVKRQDTLVMPFGFTIWVLIVLSMIASLIFLFSYTFVSKQKSEVSYGHWLLFVISAFFQESNDQLITLKSNGLRIFLALFLSMTFILSSSYAGLLVSFLSIPPKLPIFHTLKDVAQSPIPLVQYNAMKEDSDPNVYREMILSRTFEHVMPPTLLPIVLKGNLISYGSKLLYWQMIKDDIIR